MSGFKLLADTNVLIGLEANQPVQSSLAELVRLSVANGVELFIDDASYADIERDKDESRRQVTLSKLQKFQKLQSIAVPPDAELVQRFGSLRNDNDRSDIRLLIALERKAVDFLVTQDSGLHKRAGRVGLGKSVLTVEEALQWLRQTFSQRSVKLPYIVEHKAYQLNTEDPIFQSLRDDYRGFDQWFEKCCREHRDCWVLEIEDHIAGLAIINTEDWVAAKTVNQADKILKICTFKVRDEFRGEKFGEQLLKKILWHAQHNKYEIVYVTAFPKQEFLINLLRFYGFEVTQTNSNGEQYLEKRIWSGALPPLSMDALNADLRVYPRFYDGPEIQKFCVPIRPDYHRRLFPEIARAVELPLFPGEVDMESQGNRIPGNTIRKVYLCRATNSKLRPGDLILFYMSKGVGYAFSQAITTLGIVEQVNSADTLERLIQMTAKRSVFTENELTELLDQKPTPLKVIDFILVGHFDEAIFLNELQQLGILKGAPQSILQLSQKGYALLKSRFR